MVACVALIAGCETTTVSGPKDNLEAKRMAAIEQQKQQQHPDEGTTNLWNAQERLIDRDGNPMR